MKEGNEGWKQSAMMEGGRGGAGNGTMRGGGGTGKEKRVLRQFFKWK